MNLKSFYRYVFGFLFLVFVFTGCGSDNGGGAFLASDGNASGENGLNKTHQKTFTYDSTNRVTKEDLGDGKYIEYIYDDSGNLISQTVVK